MKLHGQRIVITGAGSGIGRALLARLSTYSSQIVAADQDAVSLHEAIDEWAGGSARILAHVGDIGSAEGVDALFARALAEFGGIDIFIANAGFAYYERFNQTNWDRMAALFNVNVISPLYALAKMRALHPTDPYMVVITASAMSKMGLAGYALYSASKAALDRFAQAYRDEAPPNGHLMLVYPISTRTRFFTAASEKSPAPVPWPSQSPEAVAAAIVRGIERDARSVYPSRMFRIALMVNHLVPVLTIYRTAARRQFFQWSARQKV
ncbi:MAG: SDR family NAD(P)-dependent oxidoreductase [Aggregatilineales bacterium]